MPELNTFSIVARDPNSGMFGVAVATAMPAVGSNCPHARAGVGAIATQSWVNPYFGIDGLQYLEEGLSAEETLGRLLATDPRSRLRQIGIVDRHNRSAAYSGPGCTGWFGHLTGPGYAIQGNMLIGPATIEAMAAAFNGSDADLTERLMLALEAAQLNGGDKRGKQSAALYVVKSEAYPYLDLRVDEHIDPVAELRRVCEVAKRHFLPFAAGFPTRVNPAGSDDPEVLSMVAKAPQDR
jgi:uncharacterized Ntn-hydrolase superfamily protein